MSHDKKKGCYISYLLRLWETEDEGHWVWRASLEAPASGKRYGFASLDELMDFLEGETGGKINMSAR